MDYGLSQLTNDQYLDLLEAVLENGLTRSHLVRELAQGLISDSGQKQQAIIAALEQESKRAVEKYQNEIRQQVRQEVEAGVASGEIRLMDPVAEARLVADTTLEATLALIDGALRDFDKRPERFFFEIDDDYFAVQYGGQVVERRHRLRPDQRQTLANMICGVLRV
jgi:hypothetical protein